MPSPRFVTGALLVAGLAVAPAALPAQSSIFGVRGLGMPGRPYTPATRATGGSFGLFDGESSLNPAALSFLQGATGSFVMAPTWRHWESPAGTAQIRETRFPLMSFAGPIPGSSVGVGLSLGSYADRDFRLTAVDTITLRGAPVEVADTLSSLGGLNEIRLAAGTVVGSRTSVGAAVYWITGSSRLDARRSFGDSTYLPVRQTAELSYQGVGLSLGVVHKLRENLQVALYARTDGHADVDLDSAGVYQVDLPYTIGAGAQLKPSARLTVAGHLLYRTWSGANSDLLAQGGTGAENTLELALGGELARNARRPGNLPIRFGVRYAQLPFPIQPGEQPREFGLSLGTGTRFAQDRASLDLTLEHHWRSESSRYSERAFTIVFGLSVRPSGGR